MNKQNNKIIIGAIVVLIVLLGGWYLYSSKQTAKLEPDTSEQVGLSELNYYNNTEDFLAGPVLKVAKDASFGDYIVSSTGRALYLYTKDKPGISNCSGQCAINWPPYYIEPANKPLTSSEDISGELATIIRDGDKAQLTYKGVPLYFWKDDVGPGDVKGHNVGGVWFLVKP